MSELQTQILPIDDPHAIPLALAVLAAVS